MAVKVSSRKIATYVHIDIPQEDYTEEKVTPLRVVSTAELEELDRAQAMRDRLAALPGHRTIYETVERDDAKQLEKEIAAEALTEVPALKQTAALIEGSVLGIDEDAFIDKFMVFTKALTGLQLYEYQIEPARRIVRSVITNDGEEITLLFSRQSGKTEILGNIIPALLVILPKLAASIPALAAFKDGVRIGIFAPTSDQAQTLYDRIEARMTHDSAEEVLKDPDINEDPTEIFSGVSIQLRNGSFCRIQSAAPQTKIESKTYHIVIIDEAQDMEDSKVVKSIHPMVASTNGTIVKIGTTIPKICDFYNAVQRNIAADANKPRKYRAHFQYDYTVCQKYNHKYKKFIDKERIRFGEDNEFFRMSYCLDWLMEKGMMLTPQQFETHLANPHGKYELSVTEPCIAGIDLGKQVDQTVITVIKLVEVEMPDDVNDAKITPQHIKYVVNWAEYRKDRWSLQVSETRKFLSMFPGLKRIVVDATGKGEVVFEQFQDAFADRPNIELVPIVLHDQLENDLAQHFYNEMFANRIRIPASQEVVRTARFRAFKKECLWTSKIYKNSLVKLKAEGKNRHDDYVYSLLLALWGVRDINAKDVECLQENLFFAKRVNHALAELKRRRSLFTR